MIKLEMSRTWENINQYDTFRIKTDLNVLLNHYYRFNDKNEIECNSSGCWKQSDVADASRFITGGWDIVIDQKPFWAEQGETYYYIDFEGDVILKTYFSRTFADTTRRRLGNCFKTNQVTGEQIKKFKESLTSNEYSLYLVKEAKKQDGTV